MQNLLNLIFMMYFYESKPPNDPGSKVMDLCYPACHTKKTFINLKKTFAT